MKMKNKIYALFIGLMLASTTQAQVLNVPTIEQEQDLWCWAGISKSALDYYGEVHEQCEIVEWVRTVRSGYGDDPCCENPSGPCNNTNVLYNSDGSIQDILHHFAGITSEYKGQFGRTEADVANSVARNAVIPCGWLWATGGGHAVLIHGYVDGNVYYMDPWFGEGKKIATYSNFSSGNDGSGQHTWVSGIYFTSDVNQVDTVIPCETPLNVSASVSGSTISLSWPVIASAQSYKIRYREQGTSPWTSTTSSANSKSVTGLSPETTYEFQVAAVCNSVSESDFSASATATTEEGPVVYCDSKGNSVAGEWINTVSIGSINNTSNANGGYADFTAQSTSITAGTSENITLTPGFPSNWLYGTTTQPEMWSVWVDLNQDGDFTDANEQRFVSSSTSTSAVSASVSIPSGTLPGVTRMRIAMKRSAAASSCETFANGEVEDYSLNIIADVPPTCDVVSNLTVSNVIDVAFSLSWNGDVDASSYNVDLREVGGSWNTTNVSGTSNTFTGLNPETTYEARVATVCSFGSSDYSNVVSATTLADPTCDAATGLALSNVTNNSLTATWSAAPYANSYNVDISADGGSSWTTVSTSATSYNFTGLTAETQYQVKVSTVCSFGSSAYSNAVSATTLAAPTCDTPTGLALSSITNTSITASWNASSNANSYSVEIRENGGSWSAVSNASTSYSFSGLSQETTYDVRVSALCSFGNSTASTLISASTLAGPVTYCAASGTSANEWIESITVGSTTNTSNNDGGYGDYTSTVINLSPGALTSIQLNPGFPYSWFWGYSTQPEYWMVWIDYNKDGDFDDANELAAQSNGSYTGAVSGNFTVAQGVSGTTRMRIAMKRSTAAATCGNYTYGEVEDYTVDFGAAGGGVSGGGKNTIAVSTLAGENVTNELNSLVYPNPSSDETHIAIYIPANSGAVNMHMYDYTGKEIVSKVYDASYSSQEINEVINLNTYAKGIYVIQITAENGKPVNHKLVVQ